MSGSRPPWLYRSVSDARAQSEPLAVILLVGLTVTGAGVVVLFGSNAIDATQESADLGQAEHAMTQLDSRASLVAHGSSDAQRVRIGRASEGVVRLDEDAGRMRVEIINESTGNVEETVLNATMGAAVYEQGRTTIAYQGGGVWRGKGNGSVMVSPPEFHYKGGTLTLPLVLVRGEQPSDNRVTVRQQGATEGLYPNASQSRFNPLDNGSVNVSVESRYYQAWGRYFAERTSGNVSYDHPNETVTIELVVPFNEGFDNVVATTDQGGITVNGDDPPPSPAETGVNYPLADTRIEERIADCESGNCTSWAGGDISSSGTYYADSSINPSMDIDASGPVEIVVNGSLDLGDVDVLGSGNVSVYVREDFSTSGQVNDESESGDAGRFRTLVHSDGDVDLNGNYRYVGLLYAPGSEIDLNGGGAHTPNFVGGIVGETVTVNGNPNDFQYQASVDSVTLPLGPDAPRILYLHVSTTAVEVD